MTLLLKNAHLLGEDKIQLSKDDYVYSYPTPKQLTFIKTLEVKTGLVFEGATFEEASHYISFASSGTRPPVFGGRQLPYPSQVKSDNIDINQGTAMMNPVLWDEDDIPF